MRQVRTFALIVAALLMVRPAEAVIIKLVSLKDLHAQSTYIAVAKIDKVDPEKPSMIVLVESDLKGKLVPRRLPINLTGDSFAEKLKHTPQLLKRVAKDLPLVLFVQEKADKFIVFAYTEGTWFQMVGQKDGESVRWSFTHCEPYFRRTFKGTTKALREGLEAAIKDKKELPAPNEKEEPGLGNELKQSRGPEKAKPQAAGKGPLFGVIVGLPGAGIIGVLALLFPAIFGGVAILLRKWVALMTVVFTNATIFSVYLWKQNVIRDYWWGTPTALWVTIGSLTVLGLLWSWARHVQGLRLHHPDAITPRTQFWTLLVICLICAGGLASFWIFDSLKPSLEDPVFLFTGIMSAGFVAGFLYFLALQDNAPVPADGVILGVMALTCFALTTRAGDRSEGSKEIASSNTVIGKRGALLQKQLWKFQPAGASEVSSSPVVAGKYVYIGINEGGVFEKNGAIYCLDRATGEKVWRFDNKGKMKQIFSSPCIANELLYIGEGFHENSDCSLYCLDAKTGDLKWSFDTNSKKENDLWGFETNSHVESSPHVADGKVYFGAGDKGVYCLDAATGDKVWQYPTPGNRNTGLHVDSNPIVVGKHLYCCSGISRTFKRLEVFCLDAETGKQEWTFQTELPVWGSPAVVDGRVYVGLGNGRVNLSDPMPKGAVLCLNAKNGERIWPFDGMKDAVHSRPLIEGHRLFLGARDNFFYALDTRDGKLLWKYDMGSPIVSTPAMARCTWSGAGTSLYVASTGGKVSCLDPATGERYWEYDELTKYGAQLLSSLTVSVSRTPEGDKRRLYFASTVNDGTNAVVFCLEDQWVSEWSEE